MTATMKTQWEEHSLSVLQSYPGFGGGRELGTSLLETVSLLAFIMYRRLQPNDLCRAQYGAGPFEVGFIDICTFAICMN